MLVAEVSFLQSKILFPLASIFDRVYTRFKSKLDLHPIAARISHRLDAAIVGNGSS